jgi:hypothetical protein
VAETSIEESIANDRSRIADDKLDERFQSAETRIRKAQVSKKNKKFWPK